MLSSLMLAAFLMGLGGVPHCAAMCGAACAAFFPRGVPLLSLAGRCLGYAVLGAVAAASAGAVSQWGRQWLLLQPVWVMGQAAAAALGLWMLITGRIPAILDTWGRDLFRSLRLKWQARRPGAGSDCGPCRSLRQLVAGMAWALLPCGLLYAALMTAALAPNALGGAAVMVCFALPGAVGVALAPSLLARLRRREVAQPGTPVPVIWLHRDGLPVGSPELSARVGAGIAANTGEGVVTDDVRWAIRGAGAMLAAMAFWAAYHLVLEKWQAWCA